MKPRIKFGLIFGIVGLVINIGVSTAVGICGPGVALLAGAAAGFFGAQQERLSAKNDGARAGVLAGVITGAFVLVGQLIAGLIVLTLIQVSGTNTVFGSAPSTSAPAARQLLYYGMGLGSGVCFGVVGIALSALGGAGGGYFGTPNPAPPPSVGMPSSP